MSNNKDFKVKNGIQPTVYHEGVGTVVSAVEGYSISGAIYDSVSFSVSSQDTAPKELFFKPDGTKMYVLGGSGGDVNEYNLSTAWDLSTASYLQNFVVSGQEANPEGVFFKPDGTKMYITGGSGDDINEYNLSTAWDVTTASYNQNFSVADGDPKQVFFKPDGNKMFVIGAGSGVGTTYEYALSTSWDISTASFTRDFSVSTQDTSPEGFFFAPDGNKMFVMGAANDTVYEYSLSTAWDLSTASYTQGFGVSTQEGGPKGVFFKSDGTKMYVIGSSTDTIYQYSTTLSTATLDLSTGSVFDYTPTSDVQVTLSNPADSGTVSGATLLLTSEAVDTAGVASTFSTTLYTGNSGTQTITNGIDLAGDGGMVWGKVRSISDNHWIVDSENGIGSNGTYNYLQTNLTTGLSNFGDRSVSSFNSDGFTLANSTNDQFNLSPETYVSWTFKKQAKFFDVQTFTTTYNLSPNVISHNLGGEVGCAIFKQTATTSQGINWIVYHKSLGTGKYLRLNDTASVITDSQSFTAVDTNTISFGYPMGVVADRLVSGGDETTNWVGYFFANDTAANSRIKCGSYTGTGAIGNTITLGWEPQWIMVKNTDAGTPWVMVDVPRGMPEDGSGPRLLANASDTEVTNASFFAPRATGFEVTKQNTYVNTSGQNYIYIAIRGTSTPTITYDPTLEWPGGTAPTAPDIGETDIITFNTRDGGSTYQGVLAIDGAK